MYAPRHRRRNILRPCLYCSNDSPRRRCITFALNVSLVSQPPRMAVGRTMLVYILPCRRPSMLFAQLVHTSRLIATRPGRLQKIAHLGELLRLFSDEERQVGVSYLMGRLPQGRIGVGGAVLRSLRDVPPAPLAGLEIGEIDVALSAVAQTVGTASTARRTHALRSLLGDMTQEEQDFLLRLLIGELRQGALEGIMVDAIAKAAELTGAVPEVAEAAKGLPARTLILDGEVLAMKDDGTPFPFQTTMRRFGRRLDVETLRVELPLRAFFFDCLYCDDLDLFDHAGAERVAVLHRMLPPALAVPRIVTVRVAEAERFMAEALERGHEGVMAKSLSAAYEAGNRGSGWLKVKSVHTLDLVILAAEWGNGRRQGWLSNLHLGARDPNGGFVMQGKANKGLTDEMLRWQTQRLLDLQSATDGYTVHVRPELVVEIAFNEVQRSPRYPGGLALRFARDKCYRSDKRPEDADTIDMVRAIFIRQSSDETTGGG